MALVIFAGGTKGKAADLNANFAEIDSFARPLLVIKAATGATRISNTTSSADSELTMTFPASRTYEFDLDLLLLSAANAAGDFRGRLAWTNSASVRLYQAALDVTLASAGAADFIAVAANSGSLDATTPTDELAIGCSTTATRAQMSGYIVTGASDVVATLEWAQFASNANATSVLAGSRWTARRIA